MINPIEIIRRDHRKVEELFKEYEELDESAFETKRLVVESLIRELKLHTEMEEKLFYPKMKEKFSKDGDKMVEEAYVEHEIVKRILEELDITHPEDPQFDARVKVLNENITHHVMEEEQELLPKAEKEMNSEELNIIGEEMHAFKIENGTEEQGI